MTFDGEGEYWWLPGNLFHPPVEFFWLHFFCSAATELIPAICQKSHCKILFRDLTYGQRFQVLTEILQFHL